MEFKKILFFPLFLILFLAISAEQVCASRDLTISSDKTSLFGDEEMTISASSSGFTDRETIYLKGAFYQDGSTNYFGYTKKGDNWIKSGESILNQRIEKIDEWNQSLIVKSDFSDSGFNGEGSYKLKVGYYYFTTGGKISSVNWSSNSLDIYINEPDPTSTPMPTSTPSPTEKQPTPTNTPSPTITPKPTLKPTIKPSPSPSSKPTVKISKSKNKNEDALVLGEEVSLEPTEVIKGNSTNNAASFSIVTGFGLLIVALYTYLQNLQKAKRR